MKLIVNHRSDENYVYKEAVLHCEEKELPFYFQFPKNTEKDLTERADPFVISLIFVMMQLGGGVFVKLLEPPYHFQYKKI